MNSQNQFSEKDETGNPYVRSAVPEDFRRSNPLFIPAIIMLPTAICWELYVLLALATSLIPNSPFRNTDDMVLVLLRIAYFLMVVANSLFIAGNIAMLRMRPKWLVWTGCLIGLIPLFGPCMGLTIPVAIWTLVLLSRPDVNARLSS
jgi:hypothetical protein